MIKPNLADRRLNKIEKEAHKNAMARNIEIN